MDLLTARTLKEFGEKSTKKMKQNASKYSATGETARGFRYEVTSSGLTMYGPSHVYYVENGRGPTREGAPKGNPTLYEAILKWVKARGLKREKMSQSQLAWIITKKIHKEGTELWKKKGHRDIYSSVINQKSVDALIDKISGNYIIATSSELIKIFNQLLDTRKAA